MFDEIELTIDETAPYKTATREPVVSVPTPSSPTPTSAPAPVYLTVRQTDIPNTDMCHFQTTALTSGNKATVLVCSKQCSKTALFNLLSELESVSHIDFDRFGDELMRLIFDDAFCTLLDELAGQPLVIVHDILSSSIPWETLRLRNASPALEAGITRQYMAENMTIAKWLEKRRIGPTLDILLVVNPTEDLRGAKDEGESLGRELRQLPRVRVTTIEGAKATKQTLLEEFQSGKYDVIHYAGHAEFNPQDRGRSGIKCAGDEILGGEDLVSLGNLPALVFFNACESGKLFSQEAPENDAGQQSAGFAEAFLRGGVANFLGTYWPVHDASATAFSREFYQGIVNGDSLGDSLLKGRMAVHSLQGKKGANDWADYMLYGSPDFKLKDVS